MKVSVSQNLQFYLIIKNCVQMNAGIVFNISRHVIIALLVDMSN